MDAAEQQDKNWRFMVAERERLMAENALLRTALTTVQWGFNHTRCAACAGWMMGPNGETDFKHVPDCVVARALSH